MTRRCAAVLALVGLLALVAACGVPTEESPRPVPAPPGALPYPATTVPTAPAGAVAEVLYLVRDDRLVPVVRRVERAPAADAQLRDLLAGPTAAERDDGLTTSLPGVLGAAVVELVGSHARVTVEEPSDDTRRSDEVFAYGQIVCTLTAREDVATVSFLRGGRPLEVPRADLSLSTQPLTVNDYASLIGPR